MFWHVCKKHSATTAKFPCQKDRQDRPKRCFLRFLARCTNTPSPESSRTGCKLRGGKRESTPKINFSATMRAGPKEAQTGTRTFPEKNLFPAECCVFPPRRRKISANDDKTVCQNGSVQIEASRCKLKPLQDLAQSRKRGFGNTLLPN